MVEERVEHGTGGDEGGGIAQAGTVAEKLQQDRHDDGWSPLELRFFEGGESLSASPVTIEDWSWLGVCVRVDDPVASPRLGALAAGLRRLAEQLARRLAPRLAPIDSATRLIGGHARQASAIIARTTRRWLEDSELASLIEPHGWLALVGAVITVCLTAVLAWAR
jgi:hypothetical protein